MTRQQKEEKEQKEHKKWCVENEWRNRRENDLENDRLGKPRAIWSCQRHWAAAKAAAAQGETTGTISRMLVIGPRSALLQPLAESEAQSAYSFVREVAGGNAQLKIVSGERTAKDAAAAIAAFLTTTS